MYSVARDDISQNITKPIRNSQIGLVSQYYFIFFIVAVNYLTINLYAPIPHLGKGKSPKLTLI